MVSGSLFAADDQLADGKEQFEYWCATCHSPNLYRGNYLPGTASLLEKYNGQVPAALEQRTDLVAEYVKVVIRHGSEGMPSFRKTEISDSQMEDIAAYLSR
ncbi:MAG: p-cresol methylhydroxylase [SAR86 cluster bacterium]|uniref:p-cresol methylhydroxylase n=1 Tax=SAR86 cluster bacterium TaxID=2030880 RepID=A0A2A5C760_9GAMM|nr:MAG: p-cresol methylhydroxylase [SAR86 cluster bacterium]